MVSRELVLSVAVASLGVTLSGCGGGSAGTTTKTTTSPGPTTTTTTTSRLPARSPPWTDQEAVDALNTMYMDFDENHPTTQLGVTMSWAAQPESFAANLFCHDLVGTGCLNGGADCRMSASIFNHKVIIDGHHPSMGLGRDVAYVFNQTMVEEHYGKCAFIYDGASGNNYNGGCGTGAPGSSCSGHESAFFNQCPDPSPHTCTREDRQLTNWLCECSHSWCSSHFGVFAPPTRKDDPICYYEMPAFITDDVTQTNHLREMLHQRVIAQGGNNDMRAEWNEVVIDEKLLIPKIWEDPAKAIVAFVYRVGGDDRDPIARQEAIEMRNDFQTTYKMSGVGNIPVLAMDFRTDIRHAGPFKSLSASAETVTV